MEGIRCDLSSRGAWERLRHATRPLVSESSAVGLFGQANCQKQKQPKAERWVILQRGLLHPRNMELQESPVQKTGMALEIRAGLQYVICTTHADFGYAGARLVSNRSLITIRVDYRLPWGYVLCQ